MKKLLTLCILFLALPLAAQITPERLAEDPSLATDVYHIYNYSPSKMTRPPRGYKPVYVSHYGRHGERYINRESYLLPGLAIFEREALTPLGEQAKKQVSEMVGLCEDNWGDLSELGGRTHRAIANRLIHRFRKVFRRGRTVRCAATIRPRCIASMANAGTALAAARPGLSIDYQVTEKFLCYSLDNNLLTYLRGLRDSLFDAHPGSYDCLKALFAEPARLSTQDLKSIMDAIFYTWKGQPCLGMEPFDIKEYFSDEMLLLLARHYASWDYCLLSRSPWWHKDGLDPIFDDIIERAEEALGRKDIAADLRFGHDSQLIPIYTALGLLGNGPVLGYNEAPEVWDAATACPMASNLQIIFFKNRKGSVLVKVLKDECEVSIPALNPVKGPYYLWEDFAGLLKNGK